MEKNNKIIKHISELYNWKDNPRNITPKDFDRLKAQIQKLGQYKPLLVTKDGEVIGGNMRLKAYKELGIEDIWVSVVEPKDDNEKLEYALSDNDRAGYYDDDLLANLIPNYNIDWSQYAVDIKPPEDIQTIINSITPEIIDDISLPDGDKSGFQQITFTLADYQAEIVKEAIQKSKDTEPMDNMENENRNGNALFAICNKYVGY